MTMTAEELSFLARSFEILALKTLLTTLEITVAAADDCT